MCSGRKKKALLCSAVGLIALIYASYALRPQAQPLLPKATRVLEINGKNPFYWWLTQDEVLHFRDPGRGDWTFVRYNLKTKSETPLLALTSLFRLSGGKKETLSVSLNGDWLLWTGANGDAIVSRVDATRHQQVKTGPGENRWMPDGIRWVHVIDSGEIFERARIYNTLKPDEVGGSALVPATPSDPRQLNRARMTMTLDNRILTNYWNEEPGRITPARIVAMGFGATPSLAGKLTFRPPHDNLQGDLVFAPVSGLMAWVLEFQEPLPALFHFSSSLPSRVSTGFWVMDLHNRQTFELGALDTDHSDTTGSSGPYNIQWTPDSQHLSFVYHNALWTVSAL